jgi:Zn-dependent protease/CBS domain-containing protein
VESQIKLGRVFGVSIGLHYSWILIALLITLSLAARFRATHPEWGSGVAWATAGITAALFFAAIVAHELAHALVARARGLTVRSVTLFALGGVAHIEKEPADARTEFWMGIAGPVTSAVVGFLCLALASSLGWPMPAEPGTPLMAMLVWLGYINIGLAVFNMIPGLPLDGGRVLRAAIWSVTKDAARATRIAALVGQVIAGAFIVYGLLSFFRGPGLDGLWMAFIGWFLLQAAAASYLHVEMTERLRGVRVADVMTRDCALVDGGSNLESFVEEHLLRTGRRCFLIADNGGVAGLITPHEVKAVAKDRRPYTTVDQVMVPIDRLQTVKPDTPVTEALELLGRAKVNQVPVMSNGRLEGFVSRDLILQAVATRGELGL